MVLTEKVPVVTPAGIVMLAKVGLARLGLLLASVTTRFPGAAPHSSVTVPDTMLPPVTGFGVSARVRTLIGLTVKVSAFATPPYEAVTVPTRLAVSGCVVSVNVLDVPPPGTVTDGVEAAVFVFDNAIGAPDAGAVPVSATLPADVPHPPTTVVGVKENVLSAGGMTVSTACRDCLPYVAVIVTSVGVATTLGITFVAREEAKPVT